jgi:arginase
MLALRRRDRYGLLFLDGHADFYQPEASLTGEAADMDLALVSGRGPALVTDIDGGRPYVRDEDIVLFAHRDMAAALKYGSQDVRETDITVLDLQAVRKAGVAKAAAAAVGQLSNEDRRGFWIHLDVDVLDDAVMPAVDYRMSDGLDFDELIAVLKAAMASGRAVGLNLTIFNPNLDPNRVIARKLVNALVQGLA